MDPCRYCTTSYEKVSVLVNNVGMYAIVTGARTLHPDLRA